MSNQPNDTCVLLPDEVTQKLTEENYLKPSSSRIKRVKEPQVAITLTMPPELLAKVDVAADNVSISRAAFIKQALSRAVVAEGK
jgi:hypothetical protein